MFSFMKNLLAPGLVSLIMIWLFFQVAQARQVSAPQASRGAIQLGAEQFPPLKPVDDLVLLSAGAEGVVLELSVPEFEVETASANEQPCQLLQVPGFAENAAPGQPRLPVRGAMLGIPANASLQIEVVETETVSLPDRYDLCPGAEPIVEWDADQNNPPRFLGYQATQNALAYAADQFGPQAPVELISTGFVRSQRVASLRFQPFQYNPATDELRYHRRIRVQVSFLGGSSRARTTMAASEEGSFETSLRQALVNYNQARSFRVAPATDSQSPFLPEATNDNGRAFKVLVDQDGIYRITYSDLQTAGFPVGSLSPTTLRLYNRGVEVALYVAGEQDGVFNTTDYFLFYGQNPRAKYTNTNVYWLTWNEGVSGLRMADLEGAPSGALPVASSFTQIVHLEENRLYRSAQASVPDLDRWYWKDSTASTTAGARTRFEFSLDQVSTDPVSATLSGLFKGFTARPEHHTRVYLNSYNNLIDDARWPSLEQYSFTARFPRSFLVSGSNVITLVQVNDAPITLDALFVNWFEVEYARNYTVAGDEMSFLEQNGDWEFQLNGFTNSSVQIFDITSPSQPERITGAVIQQQGATYQARFQQSLAGNRRFLALTEARLRTPLNIFEDTGSNLQNSANSADYLLITHHDFSAALQPLANHRARQGLRVRLIDIQDVYDEFSFGLVDPEAIRSFLTYAYTNWQAPAPVYVLLVGDGTFDPKNYLGTSPPTYIPPYLAEVDLWLGETAADNRFVSVSGSDFLPDMHLGRLSVNSAAEASVVVNKILSYEQNPPTGDWNQKVMFVADDTDRAGDFAYLSDQVANLHLPAPYTAEKIYYLQTHMTDISARKAITEGINQGRLMVSYIGHAAYYQWGVPMLLGTVNISKLTNADRLPFMVPMTCLDGYYLYPNTPAQPADYSALGEVMVRTAGKGAIASFSPAGLGVANGHDRLERGLFDAIFIDYMAQVGAAATQAKLYLYAQTGGYQDLIESYLVFGDPATTLPILRPEVKIKKSATLITDDLTGLGLRYTLRYSNTSEVQATHIVVSDVLPAWAVGSSFTYSGPTVTARPGAPYIWDVANLPPGGSGSILLTVSVQPNGSVITNTVSIESAGELATKADNWSSVRTQFIQLMLPIVFR